MLKGPGPLADKREQLSYASLPKTNMTAGEPVRNAKTLENRERSPAPIRALRHPPKWPPRRLWAPPLVSLVRLGDKNCTARDQSPAAPDGAGDFPSSPGPRARRVAESIDAGFPSSRSLWYPPGGGVGRTPFSNCLLWPVSRTI